jgi:hypothetical protein
VTCRKSRSSTCIVQGTRSARSSIVHAAGATDYPRLRMADAQNTGLGRPMATESTQNRRYALPHRDRRSHGAVQTRGKSSDVASNVVIGHGLAVGSPMRMPEHALLSCTFGWMLRAQTCDLRLCLGGDHASLERGTKMSIAYGPQTNLAIDADLKEPAKPVLTRDYVWALRDSNPRPPPCKSGQGVSEHPGQGLESAVDLRERMSMSTARYPCVATCNGLETDSRNRPPPSDSARRAIAPCPLLLLFFFSSSSRHPDGARTRDPHLGKVMPTSKSRQNPY